MNLTDVSGFEPLHSVIIGLAALLGLAIGSFLNVVIYRVPAGKSLLPASRCPNCDAAIKPWQNIPVLSWLLLLGRCASCRTPISPRYPLIELVTMLSFTGVTWWWLGASATHISVQGARGDAAVLVMLAGFLYFAACSIALAMIDLDTKRLPNSIVYPLIGVLAVCIGACALFTGDASAALRALLAAAVLCVGYAVLWFIGGMGFGDVKLAIALGLALGWIGWEAVVVGSFAAFLYGGIFGVALMLRRRATRKSKVPFGPWMLLGAWTGAVLGAPVAFWYFSTFFAR